MVPLSARNIPLPVIVNAFFTQILAQGFNYPNHAAPSISLTYKKVVDVSVYMLLLSECT